MFATETVYVHTATSETTDPFGKPVEVEGEPIAVDVLVYDGDGSRLTEGTRPDGVRVVYGLHFPKSWNGGILDNCEITVRGERCRVIDCPRPKTPENTPGLYNMVVEVERTEG